ncbi:energy-coupling factor transporter ATPase [uncultured Limosilactobacillus sp.]|uniref:energy-coupling factor transporter ATPase n=1 Tax=uncultured Limosilactobacillus sp. TaxID=2837629 RepID=UPI0025F8862A|nr:energy-coupling factor transporter ATPase [uncultured Limosilactobacillus sp.]
MAIIEIHDVSYTYPGNQKPTLQHVSATFPANQWTTIIGHNGSGKSTLARLIDGLMPVDSGSIFVDGVAVSEDNLPEIHQNVGFVFQNPENQFVGTTVEDDVAFGLENHRVPRSEMDFRIKQALNDVVMQDYATKEPSMLSGGQKQRVAIAGILSLRPKILIFDEATSMLDPVARQTILRLLKKLKVEKGFTIIAISHDPVEATYADNIVIMDQGRIVAVDQAHKILCDTNLLNQYQLKLPFTEELKRRLASKGMQVPSQYLTEEQMNKWLNQQLTSEN